MARFPDRDRSPLIEPAHSRIFVPGLLADKVCVVSGGGSGLGRATALELARLGGNVVVCGRREEPLKETVVMIEDEGAGQGEAVSMDIRDADAVDALFDGVLDRHGRVDVLVNNAGGQFIAASESITPKGFRTVIELNVQGTWQMTHAAATKAFIPQRDGRVISVTFSPHTGHPGLVHSTAARAAVENMMRTLSVEWARFNIKCCAVAVGPFATDVIRSKYPQALIDIAAKTVPAQRWGEAEEAAWLITFLATPAADYISGTVLTIDGARDNWVGGWPPTGWADEAGRIHAEDRRAR
jgi:NAD(P)-dependent dehydrogenase (short-subunit alcohol dehydrogenase family)